MTVTITGSVTVNGQEYPVETQIELPDTPARFSDRSENHLRVVPKAS